MVCPHARDWLRGVRIWVPRRALGAYQTVRTHLIVDRRLLTATLRRDGRRVFRADIGVGRARWPTPRGRFYIRNRLTRLPGRVSHGCIRTRNRDIVRLGRLMDVGTPLTIR